MAAKTRNGHDEDDDESDPYKTLGIYGDEELCLSITRAEIKKVFRKLALKLHPDKRPSHERERAAIEFERARKACELLSNTEERQKVDEVTRETCKETRVGERKPLEETVEGKTGSERTRGREKQRRRGGARAEEEKVSERVGGFEREIRGRCERGKKRARTNDAPARAAEAEARLASRVEGGVAEAAESSERERPRRTEFVSERSRSITRWMSYFERLLTQRNGRRKGARL